MKDGTCFPNVMRSYQRYCVQTTTEAMWTMPADIIKTTTEAPQASHENFIYFGIGGLFTVNIMLVAYFLYNKFFLTSASASGQKIMLKNVHNQADRGGYDYSQNYPPPGPPPRRYSYGRPPSPQYPETEQSWRVDPRQDLRHPYEAAYEKPYPNEHHFDHPATHVPNVNAYDRHQNSNVTHSVHSSQQSSHHSSYAEFRDPHAVQNRSSRSYGRNTKRDYAAGAMGDKHRSQSRGKSLSRLRSHQDPYHQHEPNYPSGRDQYDYRTMDDHHMDRHSSAYSDRQVSF